MVANVNRLGLFGNGGVMGVLSYTYVGTVGMALGKWLLCTFSCLFSVSLRYLTVEHL